MMRVTRFSKILATIFSLIAITGSSEKSDEEAPKGGAMDERDDDVGEYAIENTREAPTIKILQQWGTTKTLA